jgi:hypothetical protein
VPSKRLKLLAQHPSGVVGEYPILSMQRSLEAAGVPVKYNATSKPVQLVARVLARASLMRRIADLSSTAYLTPIMYLSEGRLFPQCYFAETLVYCFDCWPSRWDRWEKFFRRHRMRIAMFSARQSAEYFCRRVPKMESIWMPEAVDPTDYRGEKALGERSIDVLELGRRFDEYHEKIRDPLAAAGRSHQYEKQRGAIIFPTRDNLLVGFGDSKISVCFPSSMTHPQRSGNVETVTHRYFESMASRCILLGHCPAELSDLFGYNPVVEADLNDPTGQIESILARPDAHKELVERNDRKMLDVATWDLRVKQILNLLKERGYHPA